MSPSTTNDKGIMTKDGDALGPNGLSQSASEVEVQSKNMPGAFHIDMPSSMANSEGITTQGEAAIGASGTTQEDSEVLSTSISVANPVDMPLSVIPSSSVDDVLTLLPRSVYRARSMVATEDRVTEATYLSFADAVMRRRSLSRVSKDEYEVKDPELARAFGLPVPMVQSLPTSTTKIRIHFIRHGQAAHNIKSLLKAYRMRNPELTPLGHLQCEAVLKTFPHMDKITHILCSPLTRTLETALECFKPVIDRGLKIVAWHQLIEYGPGPLNTGDPLPVLKQKMAGLPVDLSNLSDGWERNTNIISDGKARARNLARRLHSICQHQCQREGRASEPLDTEILVISHGGLLKQLLRGHPKFANCQFRSCEFASSDQVKDGASEFDLFETDESKAITSVLDWTGLKEILKGSLEEGLENGLEEGLEGRFEETMEGFGFD